MGIFASAMTSLGLLLQMESFNRDSMLKTELGKHVKVW